MNQSKFLRFSVAQRIEHWCLVTSFLLLAVTGLVQKYPHNSTSIWTIKFIGGIESVRVTHHWAAALMLLIGIYHIGELGYKIFVSHSRMTMLPGIEDVNAALRTLLFNFGFSREKPQEGRYTFAEKFEYWALLWGTVVMAVTGLIMWNPIAATKVLPGEWVPISKSAHGGEALLAVLSILIWHFYSVHIKHFNKSMFTGYLSREKMLDEHSMELEELESGILRLRTDPERFKRRQRSFSVIFGLLGLGMVVGLYYFLTFEETALTTIPPAESVRIYAPYTPTPFPTPLPTNTAPVFAGDTWNTGIADIFMNRCGACHGSVAVAGLDVREYQRILQGSQSGAVILLGDSNGSLLIQLQVKGGHPGQLTGDELALVRKWIDAGSPE